MDSDFQRAFHDPFRASAAEISQHPLQQPPIDTPPPEPAPHWIVAHPLDDVTSTHLARAMVVKVGDLCGWPLSIEEGDVVLWAGANGRHGPYLLINVGSVIAVEGNGAAG
jgi:hypothetical protein